MAEIITKEYPVSGFDRISFRAVGDVKIIQGEEEGLTVSGSPDALEHVKVDVEGSELVIKLYTWHDFFFVPKRADYVIRVKNLHGVEVAGQADVYCEEWLANRADLSISGSGAMKIKSLESGDVHMSVSGSSHIAIDELAGEKVEVRASGSAKFEFAGKADSLDFHSSGSSNLYAFGLAVEDVNLHISGSGNFEVLANRTLDVKVSGSGDVKYRGEPRVTQSVSGNASITQAG